MNKTFIGRHCCRISIICLLTSVFLFDAGAQETQAPTPVRRFIRKQIMQGASMSLMVKEVGSGRIIYDYDSGRKLTPASVTKTITTATALEILGKDFRFETSVQYDGRISDGVLDGNLYICGSGDPTLCSSELKTPKDSIIDLWATAVKNAGIRKINGKVIADESIFDTEGVSMKWLREDLGSNYGQGSYGINIFDNLFRLFLNTEAAGTRPTVSHYEPHVPLLKFNNYMSTRSVTVDSFYITGFPYSNERYLYGVVRPNRTVKIEGDIPDPPLFAAQYFCEHLANMGIAVEGAPSCMRLSDGDGASLPRRKLITTGSPPLDEIVQITNFVSHNLYADALVKTLGLRYETQPGEIISSFERGTKVIIDYWTKKGLNTSSLILYDGSGLAPADKVTAAFLCDLYIYMATKTDMAECFFNSLPRVGFDGTVRAFLYNSALAGNHLKSGSMSNVQCYGGYIVKDGKKYVVALLVNNFSGKNNIMRTAIEELFLALF